MTRHANFVNGFVGTAASPGEVQQQFALRAEQPLALYSLGAYFQDEFRVSQKLKLTLGVALLTATPRGYARRAALHVP